MDNTSSMRKGAANVADKAADAGSSALDKVKDVASQAGHAVGSAATAAGHAVGSAATTVGHTADNAVGSVGSGMHSLADTIHQKGPDHGVLGKAADAVANTLEKGGKYLEEKKISGMAEDVTELIKRNPIPALLIGVGLGYLLARTLRS